MHCDMRINLLFLINLINHPFQFLKKRIIKVKGSRYSKLNVPDLFDDVIEKKIGGDKIASQSLIK